MKDEEFETLKKRFFLGVFVAILSTVPMILFFGRTFKTGDVLSKINNKETFTILVVNRNCSLCESVKNTLDVNNVNYLVVNRYSNTNYDTIMKKLNVDNRNEEFPIIVYISKGEMSANLFVSDNEEFVLDFINEHKLINTRK